MNGPGPMSWIPYNIPLKPFFMAKPQNQKKKKPKRTVPKKAVRKMAKNLPCSPAACRFAEALLYPERNLSNVGLPSGELALPSWKFRTTCTVTWSTGVTDVGCLSIDPYNCWVAGNGSAAVLATTSSFGGTTIPTGTSANVLAANIRSPYASWNGTDQFRLVACGAVTEPITPGLNRGGLLFSYVDPQHISQGGFAISGHEGQQSSTVHCFGTGAAMIKSLYGPPVKTDELQFRSAVSASRPWVIGAFSAESQTFFTTLTFYYEMTGGNMSSMTPSESSPQQAAIIGSAVADAVLSNPSHQPMTEGFVHSLGRGISDQLSRVGYALGSALIHGGVSYVAQAASAPEPRRLLR